jgi:hypothetical protein
MIIDLNATFTDRDFPAGTKVNNQLRTIQDTINDHDQARRAWSAFCLAPTVVTSGASYAMSRNQSWLVVNKASGSATAVTLPATPITGHVVCVKDGKGDGAANNVTISAASGNIDGAASKTISSNYGSMILGYNGTEWNVLSAS